MGTIDAKKLHKEFSGKNWKTAESAAELFTHEPAELPIRFLSPKKLMAHLIDGYEDYLSGHPSIPKNDFKCLKGGEWSDPNLVPVAAVGYPDAGEEEDDDFLESAFAYLFVDSTKNQIIYATSDEWTRENSLEDMKPLGLHEA